MREIIINKNRDGNKIVALLENGKLVEQYCENQQEQVLEGNIYCGKVKNVLPGMQAAFVDIAEDKNAFIHIKDIIPKVSTTTGNKGEDFSKYKISNYIKQNDSILVQVRKDEIDQKGARITKHISLTGRLVVLMVDSKFITVSQKITKAEEKLRLKQIVKEILDEHDENFGLIIRTGAENKSREELKEDIDNLVEQWKQIKKKFEKAKNEKNAQILYKNEDVITKFLISILETKVDEITVNDKEIYDFINDDYKEKIEKEEIKVILNTNEDLMQKHELQTQLEKLQNRKIWLNCGGFITIDKTEALTAIDVNSGKFTGSRKLDKNGTILKVNKEATIEIAKQLKLRNISGIIVIDYIDMEKNEDRNLILQLLNEELKKDRSKTQVEGFTKLDLLEMTRKKL